MQSLPLFDGVKPESPPKDVQSSSKESYGEVKASGKAVSDLRRVLKSLDDYSSFHSPSTPTARELHKWMNACGRTNSDPNSIRPRMSEAEEEGFIAKGEKRKCAVTNKRVFTWSLTPKGKAALQVVK